MTLVGITSLLSLPIRAEELQKTLEHAVAATVQEFKAKNFKSDQIAVTVRVLREGHEEQAAFRGNEPIYPASVVKLFYLVTAHQWMEDQTIKDTPELRQALRDMIVDSSNDATHYVLDILTDTVSGPELSAPQMAMWILKRNAVNRHFAKQGYQGINVNQKPWCEGPYGRDRVFVEGPPSNRNALTTDAVARLMAQIVTGKAATPKRSAEMMELLQRDPFSKAIDPEDQAHGFTGLALKPGAKLWSKAGWTSRTRHDSAYVELSNGVRVVLVIFTIDQANERGILPALCKRLFERLESSP